MKKRILSMMLAIAMVLSMLSGIALTSSAADDAKVYTLVTDASTLAAGDEIIFVSAVADSGVYNAMKIYESGNNVKVEAIELVGETITLTSESAVGRYILGGEAGAWTFFDGTNYLYTSDTKNNKLQAKAEVDEFATWTIAIAEGVTSIVNVGNTSRGVMQYNSSSDLFACYASASQKGVNIYKLAEGITVCTHPNATSEETVAATCTANGELAWTCPDCEATWTESTPKAAHTNEEVVTLEPTCLAAGKMTLTCTVCGSSIERDIPALGHNYVEGTCANCGEAEPADKTFYPVTNAADLAAGDEIIFVSAEAMTDGNYYAMLTYVSGNNIKAVGLILAEDGGITATSENGIGVYTLGGEAGAWTLSDGANYLYAAGSGKNLLQAKAELGENSYWTIEIADGVASVLNVANTTNGMMQYNSGSKLFSCYGSAQKAIAIYKAGEPSVTPPACDHANATSTETVAPTCEAEGETIWTCPDCQETWTEAVPAIGHSWNEGAETVAPACETAGEITYTCSLCGATKTEEIPALGHNYVDGTCGTCGVAEPEAKQYILITDVADLKAGDEIIFVSAAAASDDNYYAMLSYVSGNNIKAEAIAVDGFVATVPYGSAICAYTLGGEAGAWTLSDGTNYLYAAGSDKNLLQAKAELDENGYWTIELIEGVITVKNLNNADRGVMQYNTSKLFACYASASQKAIAIYKLAGEDDTICTHPNATSEVTTAPTCTEEGILTWICADCGETWTEAIKATGHINDEGVVTLEPTCEAAGEKTVTCTVCGSSKTYTIPALGHNYVDGTCTNCGGAVPADKTFALVTDLADLKAGDEIIFVSAEAMADGNYYAMLKYVSGNNIKAVAIIPAEDGTITATVENGIGIYTLGGEAGAWTFFDGTTYLHNSNTGANRLQATAELNEYCAWNIEMVEGVTSITNVANTSRGVMQFNYSASSQIFSCYGSASQKAIAIYKLVGETTDPTPCEHENATSEVTTAATCEADGVLTYTCECGETWTEVIPAIGHAYTSEVTTAATCEAVGVLTYTCGNCGDTYTEEIPALGHNYVDGTCTNCGDVIVVAPVVDESLKIYHTLNLASDIAVTFAVAKTALSDYDSYYLECVLPNYQGNDLVGTTTLRIDPVPTGGYYYFTLTGMTAVNMNDTIEAVVHMTKDGVEYISTTDKYSVAKYAYDALANNTNEKMLTLCANLLRYGAEAQTYKKYRTDALVDAAMTEEQRAYLSSTDNMTFTSMDQYLADLESPVITWAGKTLDLASKVGVKFVFNTNAYTGDIANLSMKVTYVDSDGVTQVVTLTDIEEYGSSGTRYCFTFYGLLASELRTAIDVAIYEGETRLSETLRYSMETYAYNSVGKTLESLCNALFAYSDSAKAYFAK